MRVIGERGACREGEREIRQEEKRGESSEGRGEKDAGVMVSSRWINLRWRHDIRRICVLP